MWITVTTAGEKGPSLRCLINSEWIYAVETIGRNTQILYLPLAGQVPRDPLRGGTDFLFLDDNPPPRQVPQFMSLMVKETLEEIQELLNRKPAGETEETNG